MVKIPTETSTYLIYFSPTYQVKFMKPKHYQVKAHQITIEWENEWSMEFNPDKCEVLRIHRKKKPVIFSYTLHDTTLRTTDT